jgi:beta-lactamase class D
MIKLSAVTLAFITLASAVTVHGKTLCSIIVDTADRKMLVEQGEDCRTRVTPASTTKIALAEMGFDSGFLQEPHAPTLPFREGYVDWLGDVWKQPTDPTRWLKYSVVWYSQQITHKLGQQRLEKYASDFGFGNADFSGDPGENNGLDRAWIGSSLKISPREQVAFLEKLVNRALPVAPAVFDKVYQAVETWSVANGWTIHGKTGMAFPRKPNGSFDRVRPVGWFVGWASNGDRSLVFARLIQDEKEETSSAGVRSRDVFLSEFPAFVASLK